MQSSISSERLQGSASGLYNATHGHYGDKVENEVIGLYVTLKKSTQN
jgi:hypothetical protein